MWLSLSVICGRWWFSLGIPVSSTNKTDCHDITEILLKVALNTIISNLTFINCIMTTRCLEKWTLKSWWTLVFQLNLLNYYWNAEIWQEQKWMYMYFKENEKLRYSNNQSNDKKWLFFLIFSFPTETNRKDWMHVVLPCIISTENTYVPWRFTIQLL